MPGSRPDRALDYARTICYHVYNEFFIKQESAFPTIRKGAFLLRGCVGMLGFVIGVFVGVCAGVALMALMVAAKDRDDF